MGRTYNRKSLFISDKLIKRVAKNDSIAFEELYNESSGAVFGLAMSILSNKQDADDVVQDTYISVYHNAKKYKGKGKAMAWIFTIARNHALQRIRENKKNSTVDLDETYNIGTDDNIEETIQKEQLVDLVLQVLNEDERQIVVMHAMSDIKHKDIARIMELPLSTVLSKYRRALQKLKKEMEVNEYEK